MELLDAILAFALTLAALATIVTIILETGHRALGMRRRNLAQIMKLLYGEIIAPDTSAPGSTDGDPAKGKLNIAPDTAWDFVRRTLNNPAVSIPSIPTADEVKTCGTRPQATCIDRIFMRVAKIVSPIPGQHRAQQMRDARAAADDDAKRMKTALENGKPADGPDWQARIGELTTVNLKAGVYDKVSVEHVLRRLAETPEVQQALIDTRAEVEAEFNRIARKFDEFGSAVSADFKRRSQTYSLIIGILLALAVNIDGVRILESFRNNPAVAKAVIAQSADIGKSYKMAIDSKNRLEKLTADHAAAAAAYTADPNNETATKTLAAAKEALEKETSPATIAASAQKASDHLSSLAQLGVPIGARYFPYCGHDCTGKEIKSGPWPWPWLAWFVSAALTGALIGLGAPFWFDVARRLAEVRAMFGGTAPTEARLSGKNANADPAVRREIVKNVLADTVPEPPAQTGAVG